MMTCFQRSLYVLLVFLSSRLCLATTVDCSDSKIKYTSDGKNIFVDCEFSWYEANEYCQDRFGTTLASITSADEENLIEVYCMNTEVSDAVCWLGMYDFEGPESEDNPNSEIDFYWIDGTINVPGVSYSDWAETCHGCVYENQCGGIYQWHYVYKDPDEEYDINDAGNWAWGTFDCDTHRGAAICNAETPDTSIECDDSKISYSEDGQNILIDCDFNWFEANDYCLDKFGTTLASITTSDEELAVEELCMTSDAYDGFCWIGIYNIEKPDDAEDVSEIEFNWIDGTIYYPGASYEDWYSLCSWCEYNQLCGGLFQYHGTWYPDEHDPDFNGWSWSGYDCLEFRGAAICNAHGPTVSPTEMPTEEGEDRYF